MKRFLISIGLAVVLAGVSSPIGNSFAAANQASMGLHIVAPTSAITMTATKPVSMHVRVTGLTLDVRHIGKAAVPGKGHIQIYLDKISPAAYTKGNSQNLVIVVGSSTFSFQVSKQWTKLHRGNHRLILALAQNNNILYRAPTASVAVTVK